MRHVAADVAVLIHYPTTPQTRRYTTLWNVCAQKWPCSRGEYCELSRRTQQFKTVAEKYSSIDVSTILLTDEKTFTVVTLKKKTKNHQLYATAATKKKDAATKHLCPWSTFRQSLTASVGKSQVVEKTPVWYLSITQSRLPRADIVTWCCYNSYCPPCVRYQASSSSFSRTVPGAHGWRLRQSTFLPITSPDIDWF